MATDLVATSTDGSRHIFLRDLMLNMTELVSVNDAGTPGTAADCFVAGISDDANFVLFNTSASDLIANDLNGNLEDVFVFGAAASPSADLTIGGLFAGSTPTNNPARHKVSLMTMVNNPGLVEAKGVKDKFEFSSDGGASYTKIGGPVGAGTIPGGGNGDATKSWRNRPPADYMIRITADPNDQIDESDESNNVSVFAVTVPVP